MEKIRRGIYQFDPGYLAVVVVCFLAIWPFLSRASLPQATDAELHIYRLAELSRLIRAGELFPRWAPNFYYGYGYPIFNYYAPLTYYLGLLIDFLPILGAVEAVKSLFILGLVGAGVGLYGYIRDLWGQAAGIIGATLYVYAPYILYVDPHARGDLAEAFSFALFPVALWSLDRLRRLPSTWSWLAAVFTVAAVVLSHNLMAMVFAGILIGWVLWQAIIREDTLPLAIKTGLDYRLLKWRLPLALGLGVLMAAFFWLTVALEQDAVNLMSLVGDDSHFDFRKNFLDFGQLLSLPTLLDWGATEPNFNLAPGLPQLLLGLFGVLVVIFGRVRQRNQAAFFALVLGLLLFLLLPISALVWEFVPFLPFIQFPWRLLGPLAAVLAILGGVGSDALIARLPAKFRGFLLIAVIMVVLLISLVLIQVPPWSAEFGPTSAARVLQEELAGRWLGTTSTADFVPSTVDIIPRPQKSIKDDILNARPIDRVNRQTLPSGVRVESQQLSPLHFRYEIEGDTAFPLRLSLFDFPGWHVEVDGRIIRTELARPDGFIMVPLPEGSHTVDVSFGTTPARNLSVAISMAAFLLSIGTAMFWYRNPPMVSIEVEELPKQVHMPASTILALLTVSLAVLFFNAVLVEPQGLLRQASTGNVALPATHQAAVNFDHQVMLIGYDSPDRAVKAGSQVALTVYWKALSKMDINYQVFAHLLDSENNLVAQSDKLNPGEFPTKRWPLDKYVRDEHELLLPAGLSPGSYRWSVGLWSAGDGWRLPVIDDSGEMIGDNYILSLPLEVE